MPASTTDFNESVTVTGNKTLTNADSGVIQDVTATATITLPSTVVGQCFMIRNSADNSATVSVSPAALDQLIGNGFTAADNKDAINTLGKGGDMITLVGDGVNGFFFHSVSGTWTREA